MVTAAIDLVHGHAEAIFETWLAPVAALGGKLAAHFRRILVGVQACEQMTGVTR